MESQQTKQAQVVDWLRGSGRDTTMSNRQIAAAQKCDEGTVRRARKFVEAESAPLNRVSGKPPVEALNPVLHHVRVEVVNGDGILSPAEGQRLVDLEAVVEAGIDTFSEVAHALAEIRDSRLYRYAYTTFEDYCNDRWKISGRHARRLIRFTQALDETPEGEQAPQNEWQSRARASSPKPKNTATATRNGSAASGQTGHRDDPKPRGGSVTPPPIPHDAQVEDVVIEVGGQDQPLGEDGLSDEQWLALCPARDRLTDRARENFDIEALTYRTCAPMIRECQDRCIDILRQAELDMGGQPGPWVRQVTRLLTGRHPRHWTPCDGCPDEQGLSCGRIPVVGVCPKCRGGAYRV